MKKSKVAHKRVVIVLSSGRSGTSLLMQVLGALGMGISENLIGPHHENPDGFFEDFDIVNLHKNLLSDLGAKPLLPLPVGWQDSGAVAPYLPKIRAMVEKQLARTETIWGFKDPRACSLLPLWINVLKSMWVLPTFVLAVREPGAAVRSLINQAKISGDMAELVWLFRTCDALFNTAGNCYIVHYEDWMSRPAQTANELLRHTGLDQFFQGDVDAVLAGIVKPNLNRSVHDEYQITNPLVMQLYGVLKDSRGTNFDRARLMKVVKLCRAAMENFRGWYMEAQRIAVSLDTEREQAKINLERLQELTEKDAQVEQLTKRVRRLNSERESELVQHKMNLERERAEIEKLEEVVKNLTAERESELVQHELALSNMEKKNANLLADLQNLTLQNSALLKQLKQLHDKSEGLAIKVHALTKPVPKIVLPAPMKQAASAKKNKSSIENKSMAVAPPKENKTGNGGGKSPPRQLNAFSGASRRTKLWRKFKHDPHGFFSDSRLAIAKPLRHLFKERG